MYRSTRPLQVLIDLAVDDGVSGRGHRTNIFKDAYAYTGMYTGTHATYDTQTVLVYTGTSDSGFSYTSPYTLTIPTSYPAYTDYEKWDTAAGSSVEEGAISKY